MSTPKPTKTAEQQPLPFLQPPDPPPGASDPTHDIVVELQAGNQARLEELIRFHGPVLYCVVARQCPKGVEVDDVIQEAWIRVISNIHQFKAGSNFRAWLIRIAINGSRSANRGTRRVQSASEELLAGISNPEIDDGEIDEDLLQALKDCLRNLDERSRKIVEQRNAAVPNQDIAAYHKIAGSTATGIYQQALAQLQDCIRGKLS